MSNIKTYVMLAIGYLIGRHYGRQQGRIQTPRRAVYYGAAYKGSIKESVRKQVSEIVTRKINKLVYGQETLRVSRYPRPVEYQVREVDEELEKLLSEE